METIINKKNWLVYDNVDKGKRRTDGSIKYDKVPKSIIAGYSIDPTNPENWNTYEEVNKFKADFDGIGCVCDGTILFVDLDNCVVDRIVQDEKLLKFIEESNTYTEYSPSKTGLHLLFTLSEKFEPITKRNGNVECYTDKRFFTVTEESFGDIKEMRAIDKEEAENLLSTLGYPWRKIEATKTRTQESNQEQENEVILDKVLSDKKYQKLFNLDDSAFENDESRADMSLMCKIQFYTGKNPTQMEEVFLMTPRANREKVSVRKDYLKRLVNDSLNKFPCSTYYDWNEKQESNGHKIFSIKDLYESYVKDVEWVVEDMLIVGGLSIIASKPKLGKSTLVRQMILAVSRGESFLERETLQGYVLYISLEEPGIQVKKHFELMGATELDDIGVIVDTIRPENAFKWLEEIILEKKPVLIVIDTLAHFIANTQFNEYGEMVKGMRPFLHLVRKYNTHILLVHHARKSDGDDGDIILGSTGILSIVDTGFYLKKDKEKNRTLETQQRYGESLETTILDFNPVTRTLELGVTKIKNQMEILQGQILEYLKSELEWKLEEEILKAVGGNTKQFRKALRNSVKDKKVFVKNSGKRGSPFLYSCFTPIEVVQETSNLNYLESASLDTEQETGGMSGESSSTGTT